MSAKIRTMALGLVVIGMLGMIPRDALAQGANPAGPQNIFQARCEEQKLGCTTTFLEDTVEVSCAYPPADWRTQPVYAEIVVVHRCQFEKHGGQAVLVCRGLMGASPHAQRVFTNEEFKDMQARCSKLCSPCPKGWK